MREMDIIFIKLKIKLEFIERQGLYYKFKINKFY